MPDTQIWMDYSSPSCCCCCKARGSLSLYVTLNILHLGEFLECQLKACSENDAGWWLQEVNNMAKILPFFFWGVFFFQFDAVCFWKCQYVFAGCDAIWAGLSCGGGFQAAQRWPVCHMDGTRLRPCSQRSWAEVHDQQHSLCYGLWYHDSLWAWGTCDVLCVLWRCDRCRVYVVSNSMQHLVPLFIFKI